MKLSVCMATYNGEKFIKEQIESILNQTHKPDEIIISDDASKDKTQDILIEYQKRYPDLIKVILNKDNAGFVKNFERALLASSGDLVALSDQDDVWLPEKLQEEYSILEKNPNVGLTFSDLKLVDENLNEIEKSMWEYHNWKMNGYIKGADFFESILKFNRVTGCTIMIRRQILNDLIPFDSRIHLHDYWLALGSSLLSDVFAINKQLVLYRQHSNNQIGAGINKTINYDQYLANLQKEAKGLFKEKEFREYIFEYVKEHTKNYLIIKRVDKYRVFNELRYKLYSGQSLLNRLLIVFRLTFRINLYADKKSFLRDIFSSKIRKLRFLFVSKIKNINTKEN